MFSFWQRLNAIFFFALSVLGFLSFLGAGMTYWHVSSPRIELTLEKILLRKIYGAGHDQVVAPSTLRHRSSASHLTPRTHLAPRTSRQAVLTLGIDADLRSVWNWNVKQLFVYVTAEYETKPNVLNQVVVWDTIISDSPSVRTRPLRVTAPPRRRTVDTATTCF